MEENRTNETINIETKPIETEPEVNESSDVKSTVIKCVALFCCAIILLVAVSSCFKSAEEGNQSIIDKLSASSTEDAFFTEDFDDLGSDDSGNQAQAPAGDASANAAGDNTATSGDTAQQPGGNTVAPQGGAQTADTGSKKPSTKAEILEYYNTVINKVKPNAKSITQVMEKNYQAASIDLGSLGMFTSVVNGLIESNMGENKDKMGVTATSVADKNKIFPMENETWASKLTIDDIKDAKCVENNGVYTIALKLVDDPLMESTKHGASHHGRGVSIVQTDSIYSNAGGAKSLLKGLKIGYSNGQIMIKVDAKTGNVTHASYDFTWTLHVDVFGGINAPFGIRQDFLIKW